jgi:hypothetical protein
MTGVGVAGSGEKASIQPCPMSQYCDIGPSVAVWCNRFSEKSRHLYKAQVYQNFYLDYLDAEAVNDNKQVLKRVQVDGQQDLPSLWVAEGGNC